jgi:hypothetical protein
MPRLPILARIAVLLTLALAPACASLGDGQVDLTRIADRVALVQADLADLELLVSPESAVHVAKLRNATTTLEVTLRAAAAGGSISNIPEAAQAVLLAAGPLIDSMEPSPTRDALIVARVLVRHLSLQEFDQAEDVVVPEPVAEVQ